MKRALKFKAHLIDKEINMIMERFGEKNEIIKNNKK